MLLNLTRVGQDKVTHTQVVVNALHVVKVEPATPNLGAVLTTVGHGTLHVLESIEDIARSLPGAVDLRGERLRDEQEAIERTEHDRQARADAAEHENEHHA